MKTFHSLGARFGALLRRLGQDFSRSFPADLWRDAFGGGGRIGELLHEREDLCDQIEERDEAIAQLQDENQRLQETLTSTSQAYQNRGVEIEHYQRLSNYRIDECNRLKAELAHYHGLAKQNEDARYKRLDALAKHAAAMRIGAPPSLN